MKLAWVLAVVWLVTVVLCAVVAIRGRKFLDRPGEGYGSAWARREALTVFCIASFALPLIWVIATRE